MQGGENTERMKIDLKIEKETVTHVGTVVSAEIVFEAHALANKDILKSFVASMLLSRMNLPPMSTTTEKAESKTPVA